MYYDPPLVHGSVCARTCDRHTQTHTHQSEILQPMIKISMWKLEAVMSATLPSPTVCSEDVPTSHSQIFQIYCQQSSWFHFQQFVDIQGAIHPHGYFQNAAKKNLSDESPSTAPLAVSVPFFLWYCTNSLSWLQIQFQPSHFFAAMHLSPWKLRWVLRRQLEYRSTVIATGLLCVTLIRIQQVRQIKTPSHTLHCIFFLKILCTPGMLR